jgi:hypothetical protein
MIVPDFCWKSLQSYCIQFICYVVQPMYVCRTGKRCVDKVW